MELLIVYYFIIFITLNTVQKMKFSIKVFFSKCGQLRRFLRIWSDLLKKPLMENFIFCAVIIHIEFWDDWLLLLIVFSIFLKIATIVGSTSTFRNILTPNFKNLPQAFFLRILSGLSPVSVMYLVLKIEHFEKSIFLTVILSKPILFSLKYLHNNNLVYSSTLFPL